MPVEQIAAVAAEEYSIIHNDMNSFSQMVAQRWDTPNGSHFFGDLADGETLALPLLLAFGAYEPRPKGQTYPSRVPWIAANADRASAAASFLVNFGVFGENMASLRDALIGVFGFTPDEIEFFTFFAEPIPGFEDDAIQVIAVGLLEGACPRDVRRSARLLQAYELDFWQAASDPPGSPLPVVREPQPRFGRGLRRRSSDGDRRRFVLFVDDSQLLDPTSATLIGQMLDAGLLLLLATVRDGHLMLDVGNPQGDSWVQRPSHRDESRVLRSFTEVVDAR